MTSLDEIVEVFEMLGDWDQRYQFLMELGEELPPMPDPLKTDDNKVKGCMSQVWVSPYPDDKDQQRWHFHAECDTAIIKGVLAVLVKLVDGKTADQIQQLDVDEIFERLQLYDHLSPNRHVGIYAIVELMKKLVKESQQNLLRIA